MKAKKKKKKTLLKYRKRAVIPTVYLISKLLRVKFETELIRQDLRLERQLLFSVKIGNTDAKKRNFIVNQEVELLFKLFLLAFDTICT